MGDDIHIRGIIEFSNFCGKACLYCGLRYGNGNVRRYRMSMDEVFDNARKAMEMGYKTVVLQSGEDRAYPAVDHICGVVRRIKEELDLAVTLSIGELEFGDYEKLRRSGADRYLIRFETSDRQLFERIKPDGDYDKRRQKFAFLKELGFQVGSGIMSGLPGQTYSSIADDIFLFRELDLDMIGNGPFIPNPDTPLGGCPGGDILTALKITAITRLVTGNTHIPATTAMGSIDPMGRQKALKCGANVIMPNMTPADKREHYLLYPGKICVDEKPDDCSACVRAMALSLGRTVAAGHGHSLKRGPWNGYSA